MKEDITRIMKLVQEGKLSPDDAAELIDAMNSTGQQEMPEADPVGQATQSETRGATTPPPPPSGSSSSPFGSLIDAIEKLGRDVTSNVDWNEVSTQMKEGVKSGADAIKKAAAEFKSGKFNIGFFDHESKEIRQPLVVPSGKILRIEATNGDIEVKVNPSTAPEVIANAKFKGSDPEVLKQRAAEFALVIEESDHFVMIRQPDQLFTTVDLSISLAEACPIEIRTDSGDVKVIGARGSCRVHVSNGDIHLEDIDGTVEITNMDGDIQVATASVTMLNVDNKNGDISFVDVQGAMNVRSTSGDIKFQNCGGKTVSVQGVSGDLVLDFLVPIEGTLIASTVSGDIWVTIPDQSSARTKVSSLQGTCTAALLLQDVVQTDRKVEGRLGEGAGTIDISAVSGDVTIRLRESATL